jgi:hypothetical protein
MATQTSEDRAPSCAFTYSDGRQCRMLRRHNSKFCLYHERKMRHLREADCTAASVAEPLSGNLVSSTALNQSLSRLFCAVADGAIPPKVAAQLISLSKVLAKNIGKADEEFMLAFGTRKYKNRMVRRAYGYVEPHDENSATPTSGDRSKPCELPKTGPDFVAKVLERFTA